MKTVFLRKKKVFSKTISGHSDESLSFFLKPLKIFLNDNTYC